jgi:hypothetical protein
VRDSITFLVCACACACVYIYTHTHPLDSVQEFDVKRAVAAHTDGSGMSEREATAVAAQVRGKKQRMCMYVYE